VSPAAEDLAPNGWIARPDPGPAGRAVFLAEILAELPAGSRVLDAGCGPGSWNYEATPHLAITGFDVLPLSPRRPWRPRTDWLRADMGRQPFRDGSFDAVFSHYTLEHVSELSACADELARVLRPGGLLYVSVPRSTAFDDRFYRFAGYFAKYGLMKFGKRIEHQQRFSFTSVMELFYARGFVLEGFSLVPAGFSWLNDPRTKPFQAAFVGVLGAVKRALGLDLFAGANFVCRFRQVGTVGLRRVTHVCRHCGEQSVLTPPEPPPPAWTCPFCGEENGLFVSPAERRAARARAARAGGAAPSAPSATAPPPPRSPR
jgi:SAM-dependent methyltransferase